MCLTLRKTDSRGRSVLPRTDLAGARVAAERLLADVAGQALTPVELGERSIELSQLLLRFLTLGHVLIRSVDMSGPSGRIFGNGNAYQHQPKLAAPAKNARFDLRAVIRVSRRYGLGKFLAHQMSIVGMHKFPGESFGGHQVAALQFGGGAMESVKAVAEGKEPAGHLIFPVGQSRQAHGLGEALFHVANGVLRCGQVLAGARSVEVLDFAMGRRGVHGRRHRSLMGPMSRAAGRCRRPAIRE